MNNLKQNTAIIGLQFGDEGKGKIVDLITQDYDIVARFQGGDNAGHTIVIDGIKYKLSIIPSGILHGKTVFLGSGVVINPYKLDEEVRSIDKVDVKNLLHIDDSCHVIFKVHQLMDAMSEKIMCDNAIGTTKKGIGPCYQTKIQRIGIRVCDIINLDEKALIAKISPMINSYNLFALEHGQSKIEINDISKEINDFKRILYSYKIVNGYDFVQKNIDKLYLFEGAQGCGLDINHGTYPYVTSSSTFASQVYSGASFPNGGVKNVLGVLKAYTTRVGNGWFATENSTNQLIKDQLQSVGQEIGTVTGRIRRCGWLDLVMTKKFVQMNGVTEVALTKIDVLDNFDKIQVCIGYKLNGIEIDYLPSLGYENIEPIYKEFDGWSQDGKTEGKKNYDELAINAKLYIEYIEEFLGAKISIVSTGPDRNDTIFK